MMARGRGGLLAGCVVLIAGCGSGASHPTSGQTPKQIVADASASLRNAHGFEMQGSIIEGKLRATLALVAAPSLSTDLRLTLGATSAELIHARGGDFIRGNGAFWSAHVGARAARLADRWIQIPTAGSRAFTASLGSLAPDVLARCLAEDHGTLTVAGRRTVDGHRAVVIKDAGDTPGSSPGILTVAADGGRHPLSYTATGGTRPGGRIDVCNDGKGDGAHGTLTFNHFGHVPPISAPANPLRLAQPPTV